MRDDTYQRERAFFAQVRDYFGRVYRAPDLQRGAPIDTQCVAADIKDALRAKNIQQKLIGELVLDVGQGDECFFLVNRRTVKNAYYNSLLTLTV